jgi:hypothetical protein
LLETKNKLNEAKYFLGQIKKSLDDPEILGFNLSAFVSASRSVTLFMQKEFKGSLRFENWYLDMQKKMKLDCVLQFFNSLRVCSIHIRSIKINRHISIHLSEPPIQIFESVGVKVIRNGNVIQESTSPLTISSPSRDPPSYDSSREVKMYFEEKPDEDGYELCEEYLNRIENIVEECFRVVKLGMK